MEPDTKTIAAHDDWFLYDMWGCWRKCPGCNYVYPDIYDAMKERGIADPWALSAQDNERECPYCHPELAPAHTAMMRRYYPEKGDADADG